MMILAVLVRREFWEHRSAFIMIPAIITSFFLALILLLFTISSSDIFNIELSIEGRINIDMSVDQDDEEIVRSEEVFTGNKVTYMLLRLADLSELKRQEILNRGLQTLGAPLIFVLWCVIFFYFLACLYDERRDRSILFWKSMPVSASLTVISKLLTGVLIVPMIYLAGVALLQFSAMVLVTLATMNTDISALEKFWGPANIFANWFRYIGAILFYSLWFLPFYAWLLFVSAFARSLPLAWALGVPFGLVICERVFLDQTILREWMGRHFVPLGFINSEDFSLSSIVFRLFSFEMLSAVFVGLVLLTTAIWFRGKADEI